ncbi:C2H2 finger domain protein [Cenococcum geophilum]
MNIEDLALVLKTNLVTTRKRYIIVLKFTFKFTKEYLSIKEANTFPIPKIIFNPSLIFSPYVFLLGLLFANKAFTAPNLTSVKQLSKLYIKPRRNKLPLPLCLDLDNIPVFQRLIKTPYGYKQVARLYSLRYGAGNISNALRNLIMQHADA